MGGCKINQTNQMDTKFIKEKGRVATEQQFLYVLSKVVETFPQYSIAQHMAHIFRRKTEPQEPYFWIDELSLRRIEEYYDELATELANYKSDENDN